MAYGAELAAQHAEEGRLLRISVEIVGLCEAARRGHYGQRDIAGILNAIEFAARAIAREEMATRNVGWPSSAGT